MSTLHTCELCGEAPAGEIEIAPAKIGRRGGKVEVIEQAVTVWACAHHTRQIREAPSPNALRSRRGAWARFWARRQGRLI